MTIDLRKVHFTTKARAFLNEPSTSGAINAAATPVAVGGYATFSTSVPLSRSDGTTQVLQNYSFDATKHYLGTFLQVAINADFQLQTRMYISGSDLVIDLYVINQTGGALNSPAFTATFGVRRFVTPFA
jgi:hypothetical protein